MKSRYLLVCAVCGMLMPIHLAAEENINYDASLTVETSSGSFAPYYFAANRWGTLTQSDNVLLNVGASRDYDLSKRVTWSYGVRAVGGRTSATAYDVFHASSDPQWDIRYAHPAAIWLQEAWAGFKFRGVYIEGGMRQSGSPLLDDELSSGDMVHSANARPVPQIMAGFIDFQNIPFTNKWAQVKGVISYGWFVQNKWLEDHYNFYNYHITRNQLYSYKNIYFRSNPEKPFSVTVGAQIAGDFGGTTYHYSNGKLYSVEQHGSSISDYWKMLIPTPDNGDDFYEGALLGSWDFQARYHLRSGHELKAYFQWLWEDGSGMSKHNGWDGLWGVEYKSDNPWWIDGAVIEYLDLTNHSGPIHYAPHFQGADIPYQSTGADNYYNSGYYNAYTNLGMGLGNAMVMSPIYNRDGYPQFLLNRVKGVHVALRGTLSDNVTYKVKFGWRKALGTSYEPLQAPVHSTMLMAEASWRIPQVKGLQLTGAFGLDHGEMPGNSVGGMVTISYDGLLKLNGK